MVLMALDHTRDYFGRSGLRLDLSDPSILSAALFLTRLVTHFCAPTFVFLAGTSAYLAASKLSKRQSVFWLASRGLWLVVLELTIVFFAWHFNANFEVIHLAVIWAIGCSLLALALLVFFPLRVVGVVAALFVFGHNAFDAVNPTVFGRMDWAWKILHVPFSKIGSNPTLSVVYPILPWIGVMAAGYAIGPVFAGETSRRRKILLRMGVAAMSLFFVLRFANGYGDPSPWSPQATSVNTLLSFLNCTKYPPSLAFLAMTLGPTCLLLAALDSGLPRALQPMVVFGRVPLFYYILHLYLIHAAAVGLAWIQTGEVRWMLRSFVDLQPPPDYGFGLLGICVTWLAIILALYPLCRWYGGVKRQSRSAWLSYL